MAMNGDLPLDADFMMAAPPPPPFNWVREGTSYWLFEENGEFGIPRNGVEAEPWSWERRRFHSNFVFKDGRVLLQNGVGEMPPILDDRSRPAILGGGPITYQCLEPFDRWLVKFDGMVIETHISNQLDLTVDPSRQIPLKYEFEVKMMVPPNVQDITPEKFASWGKGKQMDAASVGLGLRWEQMLRGEGVVEVDGTKRNAKIVGSRIKRRSVRTDGLFLRGHCWQAVLFPDGRAAGFEARPPHADEGEPWNQGFIYQDGRMYPAKAVKIPWLTELTARGEDVSFELESELGVTRIEGVTELTTLHLSKDHLRGLALHQGGVRYNWGGVASYGMIERSSTTLLQNR